jgi:ribokinase
VSIDIRFSLADTLGEMTISQGLQPVSSQTLSAGVPSPRTPLCVLGDFAWDVLIRTNTELLRGGDTFGEVLLFPGGSAANVAVWASRCGLATRFVGKVGRDRFGQLALEDLEKEGVISHLVETEAHSTGSVAVFVDHTGQRSMVSGHGADFFLMPSELPSEEITAAQHLHLTAWSFFTDPPRSAARRAARLARDSGATISFDPGSFQMIQEMGVDAFLAACTDLDFDIVLPNKEEGTVLTGCTEPIAMAHALQDLFPTALIVLKLDAEGALVFDGVDAHHIPPATNNLVDATGAGDSFAGAFLAHFLGSKSHVDAAHFATRISAWVIEHVGARPKPDHRLRQVMSKENQWTSD